MNRRFFLTLKKDYKYHCRAAKCKHNRRIANDLQNLKNKKPRDFWKLFKQNKEQNTASDIELSEFYKHFKTLASDIKIKFEKILFV